MSYLFSGQNNQSFPNGFVMKDIGQDLYDGVWGQDKWFKLWPTHSWLIPGDWGNPIMQCVESADCWAFEPKGGGAATQKVIVGTTVDKTGANLGSVSLVVIRVSDNAIVQTLTSDAVGHYEACVPDTNNYFITGFLAGSPDRSGVTDNNIAGV